MAGKFERVELRALRGIPAVCPGDDLGELTAAALKRMRMVLRCGDILVYAQKIVSKAEGRLVDLRTVTPGRRAAELAQETGKDARLIEVILAESSRVVRAAPGLLIVEHRLGFVMANAGVDQSNVVTGNDGSQVLLLPVDPDASAARLGEQLRRRSAINVGVIINDSFGRPWRLGSAGVAIGCAGLPAVLDLCGQPDLVGRTLRATVVGLADEIAAAASLVMGQAAEGQPIVLVRGVVVQGRSSPARALIRPAAEDLFR